MFDSSPAAVNSAGGSRLTIGRAARLLHGLLFPARCLWCGLPAERVAVDLCADCRAALPRPRPRPPHLCALDYRAPADGWIHAFKFHDDRAAGRVLAGLLADARAALGPPLPQVLLPLPLHRSRLRERGFNQAARLARELSRRLGVPTGDGWLERTRATRSQRELAHAERIANVRGAFAVSARGRERLRALGHVALVDDVLTTGATLEAARATLLDAGIRQVETWAVASVGTLYGPGSTSSA